MTRLFKTFYDYKKLIFYKIGQYLGSIIYIFYFEFKTNIENERHNILDILFYDGTQQLKHEELDFATW